MPIAKGPLPYVIATCLLFVVTSGGSVGAEEAPFFQPEVETHVLESKFIDDREFEIFVEMPMMLRDGSERFPVLYLSDCSGGLSLNNVTALMQFSGDTPRFIRVGIGYAGAGDPVYAAANLRRRELTPTESEEATNGPKDIPDLIEGILPFPEGKRSGGAADFLRFIREELKPFINENYPTIPEDSGFFGDSLGGLFGLYVMLNEPDTFNRYILGSPSAWWDDGAIMKQAEEFVKSGDPINARLFISAGELEKTIASDMFRLELMLEKVEGLEMKTHRFLNETHTSVVGMNYIRGVQSVYDRPEMTFYMEYLMRHYPELMAELIKRAQELEKRSNEAE